ncbi:MAG: Flp pilus assembly complex ATPase component TadA [Alphaproteobacteria bacterium]|nr:Flp pilus assembly complex ATPase component TadA [Alphaproteobacteria bacterium]
MIKQVCLITILLSSLVGICAFAFQVYQQVSFDTLYAWIIDSFFDQNSSNRFNRTSNIEALFLRCFLTGLWSGLVSLLLIIGFFILRGYTKSKKKFERGAQIVSPKKLKSLIKKRGLASDLNFGKLPLIKGKETSHILITGTTGSGKTNCLNALLPQIRKRQDRAIIVDLTGNFISKFYRENKDVLLNPLDSRSKSWSPWAECLCEAHFDTLAAAIVPQSTHIDKFWENASKALLSSALRKLRHTQDTQLLYHILVRSNMETFSKFFEGTEAATYTHQDGEKMTLSIRATLANHLQCFKYLKKEGAFSVRKWITDTSLEMDPQWLFLSATPDTRETLRPLLSCWLDTAINALMTLPEDSERRIWFIIDELPVLQKLPSLHTAMAESRKYGGCLIAGVQSFSQLVSTYGQNTSQSILDLFNTKVFFRNTDPNTTSWISRVLGETETTEQVENLSYGANTMRDGISLSQLRRTTPLVLPTEIAALKDLEAYVKFPGNFPISRIKTPYQNLPSVSKAFERVNPLELENRFKFGSEHSFKQTLLRGENGK